MEDNQFDEALRQAMKSRVPENGQLAWEQLADRLAHYNPKPTRKALALPWYYWAPPMAAALLLLLLRYGHHNEPAQVIVHRQMSHTSPTIVPDTVQRRAIYNRPSVAVRSVNVPKTNSFKATDSSNVVVGQLPPAIVSPSLTDPISVQEKEPPVAEHAPRTTRYITAPPNEVAKATAANRQSHSFGINGGYNIGQAKNDFAFGIGFRQSLGNRLRFEANVGVISGGYATYERGVPVVGNPNPPGSGVGGVIAPVYNATTSQLVYLQASPTVTYEVLPGLTAGGGLDLQRLLTSSSEAILLNDQGTQDATQPDWDLGIAAKMDYQVIKKWRVGVLYRGSFHATSVNNVSAVHRRYLMVQLSYRIF